MFEERKERALARLRVGRAGQGVGKGRGKGEGSREGKGEGRADDEENTENLFKA